MGISGEWLCGKEQDGIGMFVEHHFSDGDEAPNGDDRQFAGCLGAMTMILMCGGRGEAAGAVLSATAGGDGLSAVVKAIFGVSDEAEMCGEGYVGRRWLCNSAGWIVSGCPGC